MEEQRYAVPTEREATTAGEINSELGVWISVVVPISEQYDNLRELYQQYAAEFSKTGYPYEFIFVLDGPDDEAYRTLRELKQDYPEIEVVILHRWFGEATALTAGFEQARGEIIFTLAPTFQVEPSEIHLALRELSLGERDLVISRRHPRIDSIFNRAQSWVFHWLTRTLTGIKYHDITCGLRAMKREVAEEIHLYGDLHRFFPLLAYQRGFQIAEIPVQQNARDTKSRINRPGVYVRRLIDLLTLFFLFKFTKKPLRFFGLVGSALFAVGGATTLYLVAYRLLGFGGIAGRPLLIFGALLMVLGLQLFSIGLLGEIIIFTHARRIKEHAIKDILG